MSYITVPTTGGSGGLSIRYPRHWLQAGAGLTPLLKSSVTRKSTRNADTFTADLSVDQSARLGVSIAQWADWDPSQDVSIVYATQPNAADQQVMMSGRIDQPSINLDAMTVSVRSRDKSSSLTEKRRVQKYQNQKSSDIVSSIAADHGLTPVVVGTQDFAGKLFTQDVANLIQNRTDYEVVSQLAEREGFRWYVEGSNLYFEPKEQDGDVYPIFWYPPGSTATYAVSDCLSLKLNKNTPAGRPHKVTVRSWHHHDKKLYQYSANASGTGDPVEYVHHHNGKTFQQVQNLAKSRLKDRVRHELFISAELPGDLTIDPRMKLSLSGTGTVFDQQFDIDAIEFKIDGFEDGSSFTMTVSAKAAKQGRSIDV